MIKNILKRFMALFTLSVFFLITLSGPTPIRIKRALLKSPFFKAIREVSPELEEDLVEITTVVADGLTIKTAKALQAPESPTCAPPT